MFARALKATAEKAEKLEIYPDDGSNVVVTAYGFTAQAGSGDPSPTNVREITNGGLRMVEIAFDGSDDEGWNLEGDSGTSADGSKRIVWYGGLTIAAENNQVATANGYWSRYLEPKTPAQTYGSVYPNSFSIQGSSIHVRIKGVSTAEAFKAYLQANPLQVWYQPADEGEATGLYAPIILQGGEYRATCLPLTAPLCEGDSVVSWVESGCDKVVTFDGSEDENWVITASGTANKRFGLSGGAPDAVGGVGTYVSNAFVTSYTTSAALQNFPYAVIYAGGYVDANIPGAESVEDFKAYLAANPLTVWYRSTNYTEAADIPVSLETHKNAYKEYRVADMNNSDDYPGFRDTSIPGILGTGITAAVSGSVCNIVKIGAVRANTNGAGALFFTKDQLGGLTQTEFKAAYPDLVVQATLPYKTPITYAHDPVYLEAYPDGNGKFTVSGEKLVSAVYNKSLSKAFEELQSAVLAMGANLSS